VPFSFEDLLSICDSDMDCSFFLVTVDLWSADGKHETNLVLHPSSADRYIPPHSSTKSRRRGTSSSAPQSRAPGNQTPSGGSTPTLSQHRPGEQVRRFTKIKFVHKHLTLKRPAHASSTPSRFWLQ